MSKKNTFWESFGGITLKVPVGSLQGHDTHSLLESNNELLEIVTWIEQKVPELPYSTSTEKDNTRNPNAYKNIVRDLYINSEKTQFPFIKIEEVGPSDKPLSPHDIGVVGIFEGGPIGSDYINETVDSAQLLAGMLISKGIGVDALTIQYGSDYSYDPNNEYTRLATRWTLQEFCDPEKRSEIHRQITEKNSETDNLYRASDEFIIAAAVRKNAEDEKKRVVQEKLNSVSFNIKDVAQWDKEVEDCKTEKNSLGVIVIPEVAENWAKLIEFRLQAGEDLSKQVVDEALNETRVVIDDGDDLNEKTIGMAANMLYRLWEHGDKMKKAVFRS